MFKKIRLFVLIGLTVVLSGCTFNKKIDSKVNEFLNQNDKIELEVVFDKNNTHNFEFDFESGMSVLMVLEKSGLKLKIQEYDFGSFVEGIDGVGGNGEDKYWVYYVNDEVGQVAADNYMLEAGDNVKWNFEEMNDNF